MSTPTQTQLEADLAAMIADMPVEVTFGVQKHNCSKTVMQYAERAAAAGELEGYRFSLHAVISDWSPVPQDGELLTVGGKEYRILRSNEDAAGLRWDCGDKYTDRARA